MSLHKEIIVLDICWFIPLTTATEFTDPSHSKYMCTTLKTEMKYFTVAHYNHKLNC